MVNCLNRIGDPSSKNVRFCGSPSNIKPSSLSDKYLDELDPSKSKIILSKMPRLVRCLNSVKEWMGEFETTCVNAFGTGLIAPIFIAWNPLSKADDKTKKYSALRQPLSAVLAVATSAAVTLPFNKLVETLADNGALANSVNRNLVKSDKLIRKKILDRNPNIDKKEIEVRVLEAKKQEYRAAYDYFFNNGTFDGWNGINGTFDRCNGIVMKPKDRNTLILKTMKSIEEEVTKNIKQYENEVYPGYKKRLMYFFENKDNTAAYFEELNKYYSGKDKTKKEEKRFFKELNKKFSAKELKEITDEISSCETSNQQKSLLEKILYYQNKVKGYNSPEQIESFLENNKVEKVQPLKDIKKNIQDAQKEFKNCSNDKVLEFLHKTTEKCKGLNKDLVFEIVKKEIKNAENRFKSFKNITGLILGMMTIPVSCTILNWMYPRFVEIFFPSLCSNNTEEKIPKKDAKGVRTW